MPRVFFLLLAVLLLAIGCVIPLASTSLHDSTINARTSGAHLNQPGTATAQIEAETVRGIVTLSGMVESVVIEGRALTVTKRGDGVREVSSRLQIAR